MRDFDSLFVMSNLSYLAYTSRILSPFLIPARSAAPFSRIAETCCIGAYSSPFMDLSCPPAIVKANNVGQLIRKDISYDTIIYVVSEFFLKGVWEYGGYFYNKSGWGQRRD